MILLTVDNIVKRFGSKPVLDGVSFDVRKGERVSLIGPNGTGQTTLLKILAGKEDPDGGTAAVHSSASVAYLEQQPDFSPEQTVREVALDALKHLIQLNQEAEDAAHALAETEDPEERRRLENRYDRLQHELHQQDAYH
ncbi:MAG: ATP-binding cassette domain-containing protein, partial [Planctomycetales bacterium]